MKYIDQFLYKDSKIQGPFNIVADRGVAEFRWSTTVPVQDFNITYSYFEDDVLVSDTGFVYAIADGETRDEIVKDATAKLGRFWSSNMAEKHFRRKGQRSNIHHAIDFVRRK